MQRSTEISLLQELLTLQEKGSAFLDESVATNPVGNYYDSRRFEAECDQILRKDPRPIAHSSELAKPGAFLRRDIAGLPALLTRDSDGVAHAFLNICRHRGNLLVQETSGRKHRFTCPYHAWTFSNRGELVGVPHGDQGFPEMDRNCMGLKRLGCVERYGWIWISPASEDAPDVDELSVIDTGRAGGFTVSAGQASVQVRLSQPAGLFALKHLLDQVDAAARSVQFIAKKLVGWAGCRTETAVHALAKDGFYRFGMGAFLDFRSQVGLHLQSPG